MKYKTEKDVCDALESGSLKRESAMVMKRRHYSLGHDSYGVLLENGILLYDTKKDAGTWCSHYKKSIDQLDLFELVTLEKEKCEMFTSNHAKRYSIIMFSENCKVNDYEGQVITPSEIRDLY